MDIFFRLDSAQVVPFPFPHVILEEALDAELCRTLLREMPALPILTQGNPAESNKRFSLDSQKILAAPGIAAVWKEVVRQGSAQPFLDRVLRLFGPFIAQTYPDFGQRFGPLDRLTAVPRHFPERPAGTIALEAQISVNTPALTPATTVRGPHLDQSDKLFVGLLYLRPDDDRSAGADLELYVPKTAPLEFGPKRLLPAYAVRIVKTVPYRHNTLVLFLNTPNALHGVSPRAQTPYPRYFLNLVGMLSEPLFHINCHTEPPPKTATPPPRPSWIVGIWDALRRHSA